MSHKSAWAEDFMSPSELESKEQDNVKGSVRIVRAAKSGTGVVEQNNSTNNEILIVVSKLKQFVKDYSELNTSADVSSVLSDIVREKCVDAIYKAKKDGRKTLMGKDFF